jgi:hypothetical protein
MSKTRSAFGGTPGELPRAPYAYSEVQINLHFSPSVTETHTQKAHR